MYNARAALLTSPLRFTAGSLLWTSCRHRIVGAAASFSPGDIMTLRRSRRLAILCGGSEAANISSSTPVEEELSKHPAPKRRRRRTSTAAGGGSKTKKESSTKLVDALPRTRQRALEAKYDGKLLVMGIDEAGRGPLAGPVVAAAAANVPSDIEGICDSKRLTKEEAREEVYDRLVASPHIRFAVAIVDAPTIDRINILQATFLAMRMAAKCVSRQHDETPATAASSDDEDHNVRVEKVASSKLLGCYVVCGTNDGDGNPLSPMTMESSDDNENEVGYALVDGNKVPPSMPCEAECIVKGDSKEYLIAAASILAKVTRDRLMQEYAKLYPEYELHRHKGYPTAAHMAKVRELGATPIHRRTFAPLKHMEFDEAGKVVGSGDKVDKE